MTSYKRHFTAFIESVCNKFNCPEALPALTEGFQAFCEAIGEPSAETELVERIRAAEAETGASVPGIDAIVENIQNGHVHWSDRKAVIVLTEDDWEDNEMLFDRFAKKAAINGIKVSFRPSNKFGPIMTLSW